MEIYVASSSHQENRIGVVCGKEASRKSVERNRMKRRLRECCRLHEGEMKMGIEMVIIAKKEMGQQPTPHFKGITAEFLVLCEKADALKK
jgi:ribonuclease P protein component